MSDDKITRTCARGEPLETGWAGLYPWWQLDENGDIEMRLPDRGPRKCWLTENDLRAMLAEVKNA